jgi:hypothetical protein
MSEFMGKNGFQWFVGVVEDRQDPQTLGRLRVRCLGYHTENLEKLKTADLPWAHVMNPITSATVSGLGQTPLGAVEGTWVVGFFQDGSDAQQPIIIGTLPGVPSELPDVGAKKGFMDAVNGAYPKYKNETDVNRLAVNSKISAPQGTTEDNPHSTLTIRRADRTVGIGRADFDPVDIARANTGAVIVDGDDGTNFSEPEIPYAAQYPHNHVYESESGHIREIDDTPNAERIHERHISGTGYEIHPEGDKVTRVKKDNYDLIYGQQYAHIRGSQSTTVNGGVKVFVNASGAGAEAPGRNETVQKFHYTIQVGANANVNIQVDKGDVNVVASDGDINMKSGKDINIEATNAFRVKATSFDAEIQGAWNEKVEGDNTKTGKDITITGNTITATGDPINLN